MDITSFEIVTTNEKHFWSDSFSSNTSLPISVSMFLVSAFVVLTLAIASWNKLPLLSDFIGFSSSKKITGVPSVSLMTILKSIYFNGADLQKIIHMATERYGEIFSMNVLGVHKLVFVTNPLLVQKLYMSSKLEHLHKPAWLYNELCVGTMRNGLITSHPETWKIHRNVLSKAFTYNGLRRQLNIFEEHAKRFVSVLQEGHVLTPSLSKPIISFDKQVDMLTFDIISHIAAGKQVHDVTQEERIQFHANLERIKEIISYRSMHFMNALEFIWNLNPIKMEMERRLEDNDNYFTKLIGAIREQFDVNEEYGLKIEDDMDNKSPAELMIKAGFSNNEIISELHTILATGYDTTSATLKVLLFLLASHKEYQNMCRREVDDLFEQMRASKCYEISMEALNSLTFFDMCIKECLRLYPVVPLFGRRLESPIQLDENTYLPSGANVYTSPLIIHRNPKIYPEPAKFVPKRFSPENIRNRGMGEYMPFSIGPRSCIGYKSATIELKVLTAYILHNFEVHSEMTIVELDQLLYKSMWPFPELGIKMSPRQ